MPICQGNKVMPAPSPTATLAAQALLLHRAVLAAVGHTHSPEWWTPLAIAGTICFRSLGLNDDEIVAIAKLAAATSPGRVESPQELERSMRMYAAAKLMPERRVPKGPKAIMGPNALKGPFVRRR